MKNVHVFQFFILAFFLAGTTIFFNSLTILDFEQRAFTTSDQQSQDGMSIEFHTGTSDSELTFDGDSNVESEDERHDIIEVQPFVPIIIGAGLGTTGTHLIADTTCLLGYPTMHYFVGCVNVEMHENSNITHQVAVVPEKYQKAAQMHLRVVRNFQAGTKCISDGCEVMKAMSFRDSLIRPIHDLVSFIHTNVTIDEEDENETGTVPIALHDTPWPYLIHSLIQEVEQQYDGLSPVILLSERDPWQYTHRRLEKNHGGRDIMCRNHTWSTPNHNSTDAGVDPESSYIQQQQDQVIPHSAFDIIGCINSALHGLPEDEARQVKVIDVFTTMQNIWDDRGEDGHEWIEGEVKSYQDFIRAKADFSYDMFIQKGKTKREDIAVEMLSKVKRLKRVGTKSCNYWNWLKNTPINRLT